MNKDEVVAFVRSEIAAHSELSGAQMTQRLLQRWPDWSPQAFGCRTLRAFIAANFKDIAEVRRSGLDPIYGPNPSTPPQSSSEERNPWRAWSSPNSPFSILVSSVNGSVAATPHEDATGTNEIKLHPPSVDVHREIARDFLKLQFQGETSDLAPLISDNPQWWQYWVKEIRKRGLSASWGQFRFNRLLSAFGAALEEQGISEPVRDCAVIQLRSTARGTEELARTRSNEGGSAALHELRRIAVSIVENLNETELRDLKLPLGLVVAALKQAR